MPWQYPECTVGLLLLDLVAWQEENEIATVRERFCLAEKKKRKKNWRTCVHCVQIKWQFDIPFTDAAFAKASNDE